MELNTSDFAVTRIDKEKYALDRDLVKGLLISPVEGLCMADPNNSLRQRDRAFYLENILAPLIASREVGDGVKSKYDDRKLRFDSNRTGFTDDYYPHSDFLNLAFGITHFAEHKKAMNRSPEENNALRQRGLDEFGDQYAFFPRAPGVTGLVLSNEGSVFLGTRDYRGRNQVQAVAGHLPYKENVRDINLLEGVLKEAREEFGIPQESVTSPVFVGAYEEPHSGDVDFTYLLHTNMSDKEVAEAFRSKRQEKEHDKLVIIPSYQQVQQLLKDGTIPGRSEQFGIFQPTRGALMSIRKGEMSD